VRNTKAKPDTTLDTILQVGQLVAGQYRVDHLLGEGGMAAVWAGTNEHTGKKVALKVILRSLATTSEAQRLFHSEALAASRVNHPNVVTVFDVIEHEGMACIVMELLDGEPLGVYIARKGFLGVSEAAALLLPAMRGVAAAHAQGVIHRDLKPQNIFICVGPDGRIVTTKVLDFGISVMVERVMDSAAGPAPGLAMGTPAYMSPEHILGVARIDGRADVYGFGVLLYEALTGQMPFPGEPGPDLFHRILNEPAPRVTLFRPDLPPGLVRIIEMAMAKDPDHRYSDMNLMVSAVEEELAPASPLPRSLTPLGGMPALSVRQPAPNQSGSAVPVIVHREPSNPHQETMLYCARAPEEESASSGGPGGDLQPPALPPTPARQMIVAEVRPSLLRVPLSGLRGLVMLPGRRSLLVAGFAVIVGIGVAMAVQRIRPRQTAALAPVHHTVSPAPAPVPAVTPPAAPGATGTQTEALTPLPGSPSQPAASATSAFGKPRGNASAEAAPARHSRVALREPWKDAPSHRRGERSGSDGNDVRPSLSPPPAASPPAKPAGPRAGKLSDDDF